MINSVNTAGDSFQLQQSQQMGQQGVDKGSNEENTAFKEKMQQKARSMGVPEQIIQQGREAAKAWLMENQQNSSTDTDSDSGKSKISGSQTTNSDDDSSINYYA